MTTHNDTYLQYILLSVLLVYFAALYDHYNGIGNNVDHFEYCGFIDDKVIGSGERRSMGPGDSGQVEEFLSEFGTGGEVLL